MLTVLSHNPSKTVGLVDGNNNPADFICEFNPVHLKNWVEQIIEHFGDANTVYVYAHKSEVVNVNSLSASSSKDDSLQVMVVGLIPEEKHV